MLASVYTLDPNWRHLCFYPLQIGHQMHSWHSSMAWWYRSAMCCCDTRRTSVGVKLLRLKHCQIQAQSHQSPLPQFHTENTDCLLGLRGFYAGMSMPRNFKAFEGTKVNALLSKNQLYSAWSVIHLLRTLLFRPSSPPVIHISTVTGSSKPGAALLEIRKSN